MIHLVPQSKSVNVQLSIMQWQARLMILLLDCSILTLHQTIQSADHLFQSDQFLQN